MAKSGNKPGQSSRTSNARNSQGKGVAGNGPSQAQTPKELQQSCLNIFRDALKPSSDDASTVQEVKGHLFNRDFDSAFGKEEYLRVYASRWSPSRALAYLQILDNLTEHILALDVPSMSSKGHSRLRVVCLGGGAGGELVALAAWLHAANSTRPESSPGSLHVDLIDSANWSKIAEELHQTSTTPPELSAYASQAKKDANKALVERETLSVEFHQLDLLEAEQIGTSKTFAEADLITCMFTLNELYGTSMAKTQQFLSNVTESVQPGCYFLIVDSPGSYSTVSLSGSEKRYPMQWLLDHTLRRPPGKADDQKALWQRLESNDSQWFRQATGLQYPIDLEDMRYQMHLYRRADIGHENEHHDG